MASAELTTTEQKPAPRAPQRLITQDDGQVSHMLDTAKFDQMWRIAKSMAQATLIPDHLCMNMKTKEYFTFDQIAGNCLLVVNQAFRWGFDPFAVAPETYVIANKLGFQGKLVAAVINVRAGNSEPLGIIYNSGKGDALAGVLYGSPKPIPREAYAFLNRYAKDESDSDAQTNLAMLGVMVIRITVGQAKTDNKMWTNDPQQKLFYTGATKWARRHRPELMLGVVTDDDLERMHREQPAETRAYIDEDNLVGIAVNGDNMKDPAAADARRIKAIIQLAKIESDPSIYYDLVGGQDEFERLIDLKAETLDPVQLGDKLKRRLEEQARDLEAQAERKIGEEKGHRDAAGDHDLTAEHDSDKLQASLEEAVANEQRVKSQITAYDKAVEGATTAKADLEALIAGYTGKSFAAAKLNSDAFQIAVDEAKQLVDDLVKQLAEARTHYSDCTASLSESIVVKNAAEQHERSVETLRKTIANSLPAKPEPEHLELAQQQVLAARQASEQGVRIRDARAELVKADRAKEAAADLAEEAERIRNAAKQTTELLNGLLAKTGSAIRVDGGRLVTSTEKRGDTFVHDLSDGERTKLMIDIVLATAGEAKVIAFDQRFFEGVDPANRALINSEATARGILALGARATDGELRAERFAQATAS